MSGRSAKRRRAAERQDDPSMQLWTPPRTVSRYQPVIEGKKLRVLGSDAREPVRHRCALCAEMKDLELSHIVPRWAASWTKREGAVIGDYSSLGVTTLNKDYAKQYMLCRECENYLGVAEGYLAAIVRGAPNDLAAKRITLVPVGASSVRLDDVNLSLVFRALFGIVFKLHLARSYPASRIRLPGAWERELRSAILRDDYPPGRFGLFGYKLVNLTIDGANPKAYLGFTHHGSGGFEEVSLWMGGWAFFLSLGGIDRREVGDRLPLLMCEGTSWSTGVNELAGEAHIDRGMDLRDVDFIATRRVEPSDPCPCGMSLSFIDCCSGRWLSASTRYLDTANKPSRALRHS